MGDWMPMKEVMEETEVDQHLNALLTNSSAIQALGETVQGTLGPKGLDCMLVDEYGGVVVTNDGITILKTMDLNHLAARLLLSAVENQEAQVGDGTTTTAILAATLVTAGTHQIMRGVPAIKVVEGIRYGIAKALKVLKTMVTPVTDLNSGILERIALVAGRENHELAQLVIEAARALKGDKLNEPGFRLCDQVIALEGSESRLIPGTIVDREPLNRIMPRHLTNAKILILDDALEPERLDAEALGTESGFNRMLHNDLEFKTDLLKLAELGIGAIFTDRAISDEAEAVLTDLNILGVQGVARKEWLRLSEMTGARPLKRSALAKPLAELAGMAGSAATISVDDQFKQIRVLATAEKPFVTVLTGALTKEVVCERERIAQDAAAAVQSAWLGGVVPGGGSVELAISRILRQDAPQGVISYGYDCVVEALRKPMSQICLNAGFNPLEKSGEALLAQAEQNNFSIGVDCETGTVQDLSLLGIWDPYYVKYYAIKSAGEVSEAILRINTIIKMKTQS